MPTQKTCDRCGYMSSNELCKACVLLEGLQRGLPQMGIGKASKARREQIANAPPVSEAARKVQHFSEIKRDEDQPELVQPKDPKDVYTPPPRVPGGILHDAKIDKRDVTW
jgi:cytoplasmic tRNA 2-thiolation protein 1